MTTHTMRAATYEAAVGGPIIGLVSEADRDDVEMTSLLAHFPLRTTRERFARGQERQGSAWTASAPWPWNSQIRITP